MTSKHRLGERSRQRLEGVHPDLVRVVERAIEITDVDFAVLEGLRSWKRQQELYAAGKSQTLKSRHLTGHAVDLVPWVDGKPVWDMALCRRVAAAMYRAAQECGVTVEWGGNWTTFKDGPHFQLPWSMYK